MGIVPDTHSGRPDLANLAGGVIVGAASLADAGVALLADAAVASLLTCWQCCWQSDGIG